MIPEWCKRAAEEIRRISREFCEGRCLATEAMSPIIAKHAPQIYGKAIMDRDDAKHLMTQVNELVEAAREALGDIEDSCDDSAHKRLRRALEPFS